MVTDAYPNDQHWVEHLNKDHRKYDSVHAAERLELIQVM